MTSWFKARLGQFRVSTVVLIVVFIALFWVQQTFTPEPAPETSAPAVVPPGFVPDPNYTWVPRTNVRRSEESETTTTPTSPTETTTPSPGDTTSPASPTEPSPTTTVIDPDGPGGPLGQQTLTQTPADVAPTTTATAPDAPGTVPATPGAPR